ncbi:MAG: hypothetical protein WAU28_00945 [Candidatus Moraniibacteriota bacterium]
MKNFTIAYFSKNLIIAVGLVIIWRGIWHLLDIVDQRFLNGDTFLTAFGGIILGLIILYLPDQDLKELEKL